MATLKDTDQFIVNSQDNTYQVEASQLMSTPSNLKDDDLFLVNRADDTYTIPWGDFKGQLTTDPDDSDINRPQMLEPADFSGISERVILDPITRVKPSGLNYVDHVTGSTNGGGGSTAQLDGYSSSGNIFDSNRYQGNNAEPPVEPIDGQEFRTLPYGSMKMRFYDPSDIDPATGFPYSEDYLGLEVTQKLVIQFAQPSYPNGEVGKYRINNEAERDLTERGALTQEEQFAANRIEWNGPLRLKELNLSAQADIGAGIIYIWVDGEYLRNESDLTVTTDHSSSRNFEFLSAGTNLYINDFATEKTLVGLEVISSSSITNQVVSKRISGRLPQLSEVLVGSPVTPGPAPDPNNAFFRSTDFSSDDPDQIHVSSDWVIYEGVSSQTVILNSEDTVNLTSWYATSGLLYNTLYKAQVRHRGINNEISAWSEPITFRTAPQSFNTNQGFKTLLYTGNGSSQEIDIGFVPDLVWVQAYDANHLFDTQRGPNKGIDVSTDGVELDLPDSVMDFTNNGILIGSNPIVNSADTPKSLIAWGAGGERVTNNDGSITTQVKTSQQGFSVVTWTGTGTSEINPDADGYASEQVRVGHGLGDYPSMIILKNLDEPDHCFIHTPNVAYTSNAATGKQAFRALDAIDLLEEHILTRPPDDKVLSFAAGSFSGSTNLPKDFNKRDNRYIAYVWSLQQKYGSSVGSYESIYGRDDVIYTGFKPDFIMTGADHNHGITYSKGTTEIITISSAHLDKEIGMPRTEGLFWERTEPELLEEYPIITEEGGMARYFFTHTKTYAQTFTTESWEPRNPWGSNFVCRPGTTYVICTNDGYISSHGQRNWYAAFTSDSISGTTSSGAESLILKSAASNAPISKDGYFPLYESEDVANAAGDGTSHSHTFAGVTYYMPNGVTYYHGNYGSDLNYQTNDSSDDSSSDDSSSDSSDSSDDSSSSY